MRPPTPTAPPAALALALVASIACGACGQKRAGDAPTPASAGAAGSVAPPAPASSTMTASSTSASAASPAPTAGACGPLPCALFDTPEAAFTRVLEDKPRVLAIGETHAPAGAPPVHSTTRRFTETLLPKLEGRSSDLVLELWVANTKCNVAQQKQIKQVASAQTDVTKTQAPTNQSDFLVLYNSARQRKMAAHVLVPDCAEYAGILDAGLGDIDAMLSMIARLSAAKIEELLAADRGLIVAYGGAMHNDVAPVARRAKWSFGPRISEKSGGRYVELDLIVPEFVGDTDMWKSQPWFPHWKRGAQGAKTLLITVQPGSYALIFPEAAPR